MVSRTSACTSRHARLAFGVRELKAVVEREKAQIGVLITLEVPTRNMVKEATSDGFYESPAWKTKHPTLQILTIQHLLEDGRRIDCPPLGAASTTFKRTPTATLPSGDKQKNLF